MSDQAGRETTCPGTRYISHACSVGMFDACQACGEGGLLREGRPYKASPTTTAKRDTGAPDRLSSSAADGIQPGGPS